MARSSAVEIEKTAERIKKAAVLLFAAKGYEGTSTKEICNKAKVNIAAIHYHFVSKEGLLREILKEHGRERLRALQRILVRPATVSELAMRIRLFLEEVLDSFLENPATWQIIQTEVVLLRARTEDVFRGFFVKKTEALISFFQQAKRDGILSQESDPQILARSLMSQVCHQTRMDDVAKKFYKCSFKDPVYRKRWIDQTVRLIVRGACTEGR